jgi:glutaconate CoA-transferase subunit B
VSTLAKLGYDKETCRMRLDAVYPGVTVEQVIENTGFELLIANDVGEIKPPTDEELRTLREEIDPSRLYI